MKRLTIGGAACTETLALLVTMAWADGQLDETEKEGVRGAAKVLNLTRELRERLDTFLDNPLPLDQLLLETLSPRDQAFAYVAATWLTGVDANVDAREQALLDRVADLLGFSPERKAELEAIAREIAPHPAGEGGWSHEVERLFKAIPPRLEGRGTELDVTFE